MNVVQRLFEDVEEEQVIVVHSGRKNTDFQKDDSSEPKATVRIPVSSISLFGSFFLYYKCLFAMKVSRLCVFVFDFIVGGSVGVSLS